MVYEAFGLRFRSGFVLNGLPPAPEGDFVDLSLMLAGRADVQAAFSGPADPSIVRLAPLGDGSSYRTERGRTSDYLISTSGGDLFHLSGDGRTILCAPEHLDHPAWRRFLLDTVLGTASLRHGFEALHGGAWLGPRGLVVVVAATGGGKSSLVAEMVRRGHVLFCDDILALSTRGGFVVGHPGPPLMNLSPRLPDGTAATLLGRVLARLGEELWLALDRPPVAAAAVAGVAILDRSPGAVAATEDVPKSPTPLLPHSLQSGVDEARLAKRFDLFAELARQAAIRRVVAPMDLSSSQLGDLLADWPASNVANGA